MKLLERLARFTNYVLLNDDYKNQARKNPTDFTRNRKLVFEDLILYMLFSFKCSTSSALRRFFANFNKDNISVKQQSLSEARKKVTVWAFVHMFKLTVSTMTEVCTQKWHGYRVYAIDGSKISLPSDKALREYYGALGKDRTAPTAQGSVLYDVLNDIVCDAAIEPLTTDERTLAKAHIEACRNIAVNDKKLIIFDRGYPSFELLELLENEGISYVMRVKSNFNKDIDAQWKLNGYVNLEKNGKRIRVRVVKFTLDSGEVEKLITNITDKRFGKEAFMKLYFLRWPIETKYDIVKNKLQLENFNTRTIEGIQQDFFASMYLTNCAAAALLDVKEDIEEAREDKDNKYEYKANINELIGILKDRFVKALSLDDPEEQSAMINSILKEIGSYVIPIRPKRSIPRNATPRKSKYYHNQKPNS